MLTLLVILTGAISLCIAQQNTIFFQVKEEQNLNAFVGDVSQTDFPNRLKKGGFMIRYAIQDSTQKIFTIDSNSGILRTNQVLDRENLPASARGDVFQIQIVVSDKSGSLTVVSPTEVKILDINDNDPKFPKDFEALRISESAPVNSRFQLTTASDADIGNNSIQSYRIISGNEDGTFRLVLRKPSPSVMYLYLVNEKRLDRETKAFYQLKIAAVDGGIPLPRSGRMELNITILDSNDHSPQFSVFNYVGKVQENAANGTFVVRVVATDKDIGTNGEIRFSLDPQPEYQGLFRIHPLTGEVWTNAPLDYEYRSKYVLSVSAQDLGPDSIPSKASITVEVEDENDNAPVIIVTPVLGTIDEYGRVPEDVPVHRSVAIIDVHDDDSPTSNNSRVDLFMTKHLNDFSLLRIFWTRYVLKVDRPLNLTRQSLYKLKLIARDRGKPVFKEANYSVLLRIADKNRHAPNFSKPVYNLNVVDDTKPGTLIATIIARDPDTGREGLLEYSIKYLQMGKKNISKPATFFTFNKLTGELRVIPKLWCSFTPSFVMLVEAKDNGRVRRSGSAFVKVIIVCAKFQYNFTVGENQKKGAKVGRILLNPPFPGNKLLFNIINNARKRFSITRSTGLIKTKEMLDREVSPSHTLIVIVTDGVTDMRLQVLVNVKDENDNAPIFIGINDNHEVSVSSTAKRGDEVMTVTATDPDQGRNGIVQYSIDSGNDDKAFILDKDRGVLVVFDYLFETSYELKIKATDGGVESKSSYVTLKVVVTLPYMLSTAAPSDGPVYDSRAADGGILKSKTMLVVVILCSIISLLVLVVIVVVIIKCYKRQGQTKTKNCRPLKRDSATFGESELSREAAIKASKKMYSQATVNMYSSNEMLDGKKGKPLRVSQAQPLPLKSSFSSTSPPTSTTSPSHRLNNPPPYADIYPPISTTRPVSECFSSGDELDSGRGDDSSLPSSPYSCHTLGKSSNEPKYYSYKHPKRDKANCNHYTKHPVVTLPNRSHKKKTVTINDHSLPHAHDATDL